MFCDHPPGGKPSRTPAGEMAGDVRKHGRTQEQSPSLSRGAWTLPTVHVGGCNVVTAKLRWTEAHGGDRGFEHGTYLGLASTHTTWSEPGSNSPSGRDPTGSTR